VQITETLKKQKGRGNRVPGYKDQGEEATEVRGLRLKHCVLSREEPGDLYWAYQGTHRPLLMFCVFFLLLSMSGLHLTKLRLTNVPHLSLTAGDTVTHV
jgi:hypothetical protein